jgi:hypothetical protein
MVEQIVHPVPRQVVHLVRLVRLVRLKATLVNPWDLHLSLQGRVVLHLTLTIIQARGRQCIQDNLGAGISSSKIGTLVHPVVTPEVITGPGDPKVLPHKGCLLDPSHSGESIGAAFMEASSGNSLHGDSQA